MAWCVKPLPLMWYLMWASPGVLADLLQIQLSANAGRKAVGDGPALELLLPCEGPVSDSWLLAVLNP